MQHGRWRCTNHQACEKEEKATTTPHKGTQQQASKERDRTLHDDSDNSDDEIDKELAVMRQTASDGVGTAAGPDPMDRLFSSGGNGGKKTPARHEKKTLRKAMGEVVELNSKVAKEEAAAAAEGLPDALAFVLNSISGGGSMKGKSKKNRNNVK